MSSDVTLALILVGMCLYAMFTMWAVVGGAEDFIYNVKYKIKEWREKKGKR